MLGKLSTSSFWFDLSYSGLSRSDKIILVASLALIALAIAIALFKKGTKNRLLKRHLQRWINMTGTIGVFGAFWTALRYESIQIFSVHLTVFLIYLYGFVWLILIIRDYYKRYKLEMREYLKEQERRKYM